MESSLNTPYWGWINFEFEFEFEFELPGAHCQESSSQIHEIGWFCVVFARFGRASGLTFEAGQRRVAGVRRARF